MLKFSVPDIYFWNTPLEERLSKIKNLGFDGVKLWLVLAELRYDVISYWPPNYNPQKITLNPQALSVIMEENDLAIQSFSHTYLLGPEGPYGVPTAVLSGKALNERVTAIKNMIDFIAETVGKAS